MLKLSLTCRSLLISLRSMMLTARHQPHAQTLAIAMVQTLDSIDTVPHDCFPFNHSSLFLQVCFMTVAAGEKLPHDLEAGRAVGGADSEQSSAFCTQTTLCHQLVASCNCTAIRSPNSGSVFANPRSCRYSWRVRPAFSIMAKASASISCSTRNDSDSVSDP